MQAKPQVKSRAASAQRHPLQRMVMPESAPTSGRGPEQTGAFGDYHYGGGAPTGKARAQAHWVYPSAALRGNRTDSAQPHQLKAAAMQGMQTPGNTTYQFVKHNVGDSAKLARARFQAGGGLKAKIQKIPNVTFSKWKKGREAQHLIPGAVAAKFKIPAVLVNSAENGMMLPSGRTSGKNSTHGLRIKKLDKNKLFHIDGGGSHPQYNAQVEALLTKNLPGTGQYTKTTLLPIMKKLRLLHKLNRPPKVKYVNNLNVK